MSKENQNSQPVAINYDTIKETEKAIGKTITSIEKLDEDGKPIIATGFYSLFIRFGPEGELELWDESQECCSHHHLTCDDDLSMMGFEGATLLGFKVGEYQSEEEGEYGEMHDIRFFDVYTSKGVFTVCGHNEHNGYYAGIDIVGKWKEEKDD